MKRLALASAAMACTAIVAGGAGNYAAVLGEAAGAVHAVQPSIPAGSWMGARCVAVFPGVAKGNNGPFQGVVSCRAGDGWTAPLFLQIAKTNHVERTQAIDIVLLVMNESGAQKLLDRKLTLGHDAAIAAGPVGDAPLPRADIVAYSRAGALVAGVDLPGAVLRPDDRSNRDVYGRTASARTILAARDLSAPPEAAPFIQALAARPAVIAQAPAASTPPAAPATPSSSTGRAAGPESASEIRARIATMQQEIDRMLEESHPTPVGTSGNQAAVPEGSSTSVTIARDRLLRLRQQLDDLLRMFPES